MNLRELTKGTKTTLKFIALTILFILTGRTIYYLLPKDPERYINGYKSTWQGIVTSKSHTKIRRIHCRVGTERLDYKLPPPELYDKVLPNDIIFKIPCEDSVILIHKGVKIKKFGYRIDKQG